MKKCSKSILKMLVVISMVMYTFGASFAEAENGNITITAANAVGATINLAWSDTSGIVSSYNVLCNGTAITTGLTEKIYSYELTAWNTVNQYSIQSVDSMGNVIETSAVKSVPVYAMGTSAYNMVYNSGSSMTGATLNIGTATYTTENTAVSGYSMKLNATAGSQFGYALVSTIRNNSAIASNGYLEFLIYANAASTADLPSLYVDTRDPSVGAGWRHFTYTISSQITTGKWNLVKLKLSALANDVNIADIRTLRFDVPSTASAGYNMYIQNLGFYEEKSINITTANFIGTTINLAWTYNDTNVSSYKVLCDGENVDSTTNTTFSHKVNELDKVHTYTVEALDSQGNILNMCKKDVVTPASGTKVDTMIYGSESAISNYTASACYMAGGTLTYAGANYDSSKTVIGGYSMRWNIPTNYAGGYLQYGLSTGLDMSDIISNGYIEFLIYTDAATADDLPNLQISTKNGDSWLNKNITINNQITLGKWSLVKVSLNDASLNGAYMNCIRNINFNFPSTISGNYQINIQNLGFYMVNIPKFTTANVENGEVSLMWNYNDSNTASYKIYANDELIATTTDPMFSYNPTELDKIYTYYVDVLDSNGNVINTSAKKSLMLYNTEKTSEYYMIFGNESTYDTSILSSLCTNKVGIAPKFVTDVSAVGGYSMKWELQSSKIQNGECAQFTLTKKDYSAIAKDGYIEFLVFADAKSAADLPTCFQISTRNTAAPSGWSSANYSLSNLELNKWNFVKISLADAVTKGVNLSDVRTLNFVLPSLSADYNLYVQNIGFYKANTNILIKKDGVDVTTYSVGDMINISAQIGDPTIPSPVMIVAKYNTDGSLKKADIYTSLNIDYTVTENDAKIDVYLWNSISSIIPIAKKSEVTLVR